MSGNWVKINRSATISIQSRSIQFKSNLKRSNIFFTYFGVISALFFDQLSMESCKCVQIYYIHKISSKLICTEIYVQLHQLLCPLFKWPFSEFNLFASVLTKLKTWYICKRNVLGWNLLEEDVYVYIEAYISSRQYW